MTWIHQRSIQSVFPGFNRTNSQVPGELAAPYSPKYKRQRSVMNIHQFKANTGCYAQKGVQEVSRLQCEPITRQSIFVNYVVLPISFHTWSSWSTWIPPASVSNGTDKKLRSLLMIQNFQLLKMRIWMSDHLLILDAKLIIRKISSRRLAILFPGLRCSKKKTFLDIRLFVA